MPQAGDQSAKHGRSLVGFYVVVGVAVALLGIGTWLYQPLKLRYALLQIQKVTSGHRAFKSSDEEWIDTCIAAACRGNEKAIESVIDVSGADGPCVVPRCDAAYWVAMRQPEAFFAALGRRQDMRIKQVVEDIANACVAHRSGKADPYGQGYPSVLSMIMTLQEEAESAGTPDQRRAATDAQSFARRRLAKELSEEAVVLERRIADASYGGRGGDVSGSIGLVTERIAMAGKLAEVGPAAHPNLCRLLTSPNQNLRAEVLSAFHHPKYAWLLPLIVESARDGDANVVREAYTAARSTVGGAPNPMQPVPPLDQNASEQQQVEALRKALLAWWEREGKAKYGEGEK